MIEYTIPLVKLDLLGLPIFNPELRTIPIFRKIIERNRPINGDHDGRKKKHNIKELAFIHLYTSYELMPGKLNNYFFKYDDTKRLEVLKSDLEFDEKWKVDEDLQAAVDLYRQRQVESFDTDFLDSGIFAVRQTTDYFAGVDYKLRDEKGNLLYKPKEVMQALKEMDGVVDRINAVKERVMNGQKAATAKVRGGGDIGSREIPRR